MGTFLLLATAGSAAASELVEATEEGGFGLNFDILETNLINLAIIIFVLFYFGRKFLGGILTERRSAIETAIQDAEKRQREAASALAGQQQKLAQAQAEAERIRATAEQNAQTAKEAILAQAAQDVEVIQVTGVQGTNADQERAIAELRQRAAALAVQRVESQIGNYLNDGAQQQLIDRSIALLGGNS
ncbi:MULTISPECIES: F0F1 ATP synthase subunit B [Trichocoleus]|uniref:ATP synthase subunit b n=1 Tax=Trichocoleus desertorum GB2-A4 TaxID=2933944 RepID=A0ABV0J2N7_9CYAN|nr:F0F1 ATP synthase subunit B [Trichocoleus sp. FACHB-46]MBD1860660.1 F0F1 ATP synthase subunit B [Trichocoleus sp. FACHB-46]